jgi:hypothetical protein
MKPPASDKETKRHAYLKTAADGLLDSSDRGLLFLLRVLGLLIVAATRDRRLQGRIQYRTWVYIRGKKIEVRR